ncbi:hypothetical protein M758_1G116900 [Ceratodon purpureus]|nr:hypothetical protein M758_1G116900 [Ceratodon purpureus]
MGAMGEDKSDDRVVLQEVEVASDGKRPAGNPGPPKQVEAAPADAAHNAKSLGSWARRTGYKSVDSGEVNPSPAGAPGVRPGALGTAVGMGIGNLTPKPAAAAAAANPPVVAPKVPVSAGAGAGAFQPVKPPPGQQPIGPMPVRDLESGHAHAHAQSAAPSAPAATGVPGPFLPGRRGHDSLNVSGVQSSAGTSGPLRIEPLRMDRSVYKDSGEMDNMSQSQGDDDYMASKHSHIKYEIREHPGLVPLILYGLQHYLSIIGSLILIPLVIVPAMDGTSKDTAKVISSMFMVSGISTLLHCLFGSRLPLIQGASFVYLAPSLAIIFSPNFINIKEDRFKHTMRELQGAIIISSLFQTFLGFSGLMSILLRAINPVVVAPTVTAVGLAFFAYGFPVVGTCIEIGIPQFLVVIFFALYLRKISVFGHRIFQVYAVPLGLALVWAYAFLLTESKVYTYSGCDFGLRNNATAVLTPSCQKQMTTMKNCRTDANNALSSASWFWFPYPFQWGVPTFHWDTAVIMIVASIIATVDSVGSYHATSLLVASRAPPPGVVSRGIGFEGLTSFLAGLWGTGAGATTLTENVHTIAVTKMGSRRAVEFGACVLIGVSVVGKISGFIASIPQVVAAGLLVFMWTLLAALGLSNLRYSETGSSRNVLIVGFSLFLSLSVPAYFHQYSGAPVAGVPAYFQQYAYSGYGPFHTKFPRANFALNTIFSLNMAIALLVAFFLDNTVPGSRQERGTYVWSKGRTARNEPSVVKEYGLPFGLSRYFTWCKWIGL